MQSLRSRSSSRTARCVQFALCFPGRVDGGAGARNSYRFHRQNRAGDPRAVGARAPRCIQRHTNTHGTPPGTHVCYRYVQTRREKNGNTSIHLPRPSAFSPPLSRLLRHSYPKGHAGSQSQPRRRVLPPCGAEDRTLTWAVTPARGAAEQEDTYGEIESGSGRVAPGRVAP